MFLVAMVTVVGVTGSDCCVLLYSEQQVRDRVNEALHTSTQHKVGVVGRWVWSMGVVSC